MKKTIIFSLIIFFIYSLPVFAENNEISLEIYLRDDIKAGKAFDLYLSTECTQNIADKRISISYDKNALELKNISLENKDENDIFYFNDNIGQADIICIDDENKDIILRFRPIDDSTNYTFEAFIYEACDSDGNYINSNNIYRFSLNVGENDEITETQTVSENKDISRHNSNENQSKTISSEKEISEKSEGVYRIVHTENDNNNQNNFLLFGGTVIAVSLLSVFIYKKGFQNGKSSEKKSE